MDIQSNFMYIASVTQRGKGEERGEEEEVQQQGQQGEGPGRWRPLTSQQVVQVERC